MARCELGVGELEAVALTVALAAPAMFAATPAAHVVPLADFDTDSLTLVEVAFQFGVALVLLRNVANHDLLKSHLLCEQRLLVGFSSVLEIYVLHELPAASSKIVFFSLFVVN